MRLYNKKQRSKMKNTTHGLKMMKKSERKETRKSLGKLCMTRKVLHRYCWKQPLLSENDAGRWLIPPMPEYVSRVKEKIN